MSARVFLTDSFRDDRFFDPLCDFLSAALFDVWQGGDVSEVRPDLILMTEPDDPSAFAHLGTPLVFLSDRHDANIFGVDDVVHQEYFDLLAATLRALHRRANVMRLLDHYADVAPQLSLAAGQVRIYADDKNYLMLAAALDGRHQIHRDESDDPDLVPELVIVKDDLELFTQISARRDRDVPVMFWSDDRAKIIQALDADAAGYIIDVASSGWRITRQIQNCRRRVMLAQHLGSTLDMATKDELTGLYNRRCLASRLPEIIKDVLKQDKKRLAVLLLDIDRFKQVNDYWGHVAGDVILQRVASLLGQTLRADDEVYRIGGEEFVAVLPDVGMEEAYAIARRLCAVVHDARFVVGERVVPVTISAGVSVFQPGERAQALIKRADQALYRAKRLGRNRAA